MRYLLTAIMLGVAAGAGMAADNAGDLLVDDFSSPGVSRLGTQWQGFSDRVMGGVSTMEAGYVERDGATVLALRGEVSLANNGGFVQVRLPLAERRAFDASAYRGIAVETRGRPGSYYVHLRTARTRLPWQYYAAPLAVTSEWSRVVIPFADFAAESTRAELDEEALVSLAVVGANEEFSADIEIRRIELFR